MRRFACPIRFAIRCASASPWSGVNHGRTSIPPTSTGRGSTVPPRMLPSSQSWSKLIPYARASGADWTMTIAFSCRVHESWDQFIDPVQTASRSRTTYLWCIRSGTPAIARVGIGSASSSSGAVFGGGGTGIGPGWSTL